jgi:hypothetical protein
MFDLTFYLFDRTSHRMATLGLGGRVEKEER